MKEDFSLSHTRPTTEKKMKKKKRKKNTRRDGHKCKHIYKSTWTQKEIWNYFDKLKRNGSKNREKKEKKNLCMWTVCFALCSYFFIFFILCVCVSLSWNKMIKSTHPVWGYFHFSRFGSHSTPRFHQIKKRERVNEKNKKNCKVDAEKRSC